MMQYSTFNQKNKKVYRLAMNTCSQTNHEAQSPSNGLSEGGITEGYRKLKELKKMFVTV